MIFYEDFIRNIDGNLELKGRTNFSLEIKKTLLWLGTGIPFFIAGILEFWIGYKTSQNKEYIIGLIFLYLSFKHIKMYLNYKLVLDLDNDKLINKEVGDLDLENIKSCTLKEEILNGKGRIQWILDIITVDKKQIIIPLMMKNKLNFVSLLKSRLKSKFIIIK